MLIKKQLKSNYLFFEGLLLIFFINLLGILNLYSALSNNIGVSSIFYKHLIWLLISIIFALFMQIINLKILESLSLPLYLFSLFLLLIVLFFGKKVYGAQRWLSIGFISFQPSELIKLSLILYLAKYFKDMPIVEGGYGLSQLTIPLIIIFVPFVLILKQPDLGTAVILFLIGFLIIFLLGINKKIIISGTLLSLILTPIMWDFLKEYQKKRIKYFLTPESDPLGAGYQTIQSKIAIANGGFWGKGYLKGIQSKLGFIPEKHTDFVFAVFSEEWGFLFVTLYILLFSYLIFWMYKAIKNVKDRFLFLSSAGIVFLFSSHFIINIAMVSGLFPVVGVPLPFFSYGGTALFINICAFSFILRLSRY